MLSSPALNIVGRFASFVSFKTLWRQKNSHRGFKAQIIHNLLDLALGELRNPVTFAIKSRTGNPKDFAKIGSGHATKVHLIFQPCLVHALTSFRILLGFNFFHCVV